MYCRNCGTQLTDNVSFCPECGKPTGVGASEFVRTPETDRTQGAYNEPFQYQTSEPVARETDGYAIASLILGILGFFLLPIIGGILAIVFGNKSIRENGMNTMARIGKILGIVCLVISIIAIVIIVAAVVFLGVSEVTGMTEFL